MTISDTPETDKATIASGGDWSPVLRETCRRLERERNQWAAMCGRYKQERDEAREAIRALAEHGESEIQRITKERDEAREQVNHYRDKLDLLPISWEL